MPSPDDELFADGTEEFDHGNNLVCAIVFHGK
jgi:hypothetical protein